MSLDLSQVAAQIDAMASSLKAEERNWKACLDRALETIQLQSADLDALRKKIEGSKTTWMIAGVTDQLSGSHRPSSCPSDGACLGNPRSVH